MNIDGITGVLLIFGLFLLVSGFLVGSILMALKKSKSRKVDEMPAGQQTDKEENRRTEENKTVGPDDKR